MIDWIQRISKPMDELGGFSVCPFAKKALEDALAKKAIEEAAAQKKAAEDAAIKQAQEEAAQKKAAKNQVVSPKGSMYFL